MRNDFNIPKGYRYPTKREKGYLVKKHLPDKRVFHYIWTGGLVQYETTHSLTGVDWTREGESLIEII